MIQLQRASSKDDGGLEAKDAEDASEGNTGGQLVVLNDYAYTG